MQILFWVLIVLGIAALLGAVAAAIYMAVRPRPSADTRARGMRTAYVMPDPPVATGNSLVRGGSFTGSDGRTIAWQSYEPAPTPAPVAAVPPAPPAPQAGQQPLVINVNGNTVHCGHGTPAEPGQVIVPADEHDSNAVPAGERQVVAAGGRGD